jgi:hypothetical protein
LASSEVVPFNSLGSVAGTRRVIRKRESM